MPADRCFVAASTPITSFPLNCDTANHINPMPSKQSTGVVVRALGDVATGTIPIMPLGADDVVVKVHSAPVNPSDQMVLSGTYPESKGYPFIGGLEGSGVVVEAGADAQGLVGKRVAFFAFSPAHGSWSDYCVTSSKTCFPLTDAIDFEQGACALVNPLTAEAMILTCTDRGHTCIVHSGASSQLGRIMVKIASKHGVKVINLCRRAENVKVLKALGAEIVIDTTADNWEATMASVFAEHKPQAFFDALCGEVGSKVVAALPPKAHIYTYGALGGVSYNIGVGNLIFLGKQIHGFSLFDEISAPARAVEVATNALSNLAAGVYKTDVSRRFRTADFAEALDFYGKNMSAGKVLLQNPNF